MGDRDVEMGEAKEAPGPDRRLDECLAIMQESSDFLSSPDQWGEDLQVFRQVMFGLRNELMQLEASVLFGSLRDEEVLTVMLNRTEEVRRALRTSVLLESFNLRGVFGCDAHETDLPSWAMRLWNVLELFIPGDLEEMKKQRDLVGVLLEIQQCFGNLMRAVPLRDRRKEAGGPEFFFEEEDGERARDSLRAAAAELSEEELQRFLHLSARFLEGIDCILVAVLGEKKDTKFFFDKDHFVDAINRIAEESTPDNSLHLLQFLWEHNARVFKLTAAHFYLQTYQTAEGEAKARQNMQQRLDRYKYLQDYTFDGLRAIQIGQLNNTAVELKDLYCGPKLT